MKILLIYILTITSIYAQCPSATETQGINTLIDGNGMALCDVDIENERNIIVDTAVQKDEDIKSKSLNLKFLGMYKYLLSKYPPETNACVLGDLVDYNTSVYSSVIGEVTGGDTSLCSITCPSYYNLNSISSPKACEVSCQDAYNNSLLTSTVANANTYTGTIVADDQTACQATGCISGYDWNGSSCVQAVPATRVCTLADVQTNGWNTAYYTSITGAVTNNDTASPNYTQCRVSNCSGGRYPDTSAKACLTLPNPTLTNISAMSASCYSAGNLNWITIDVSYQYLSSLPTAYRKASFTVHHSSNCSGAATATYSNLSPSGNSGSSNAWFRVSVDSANAVFNLVTPPTAYSVKDTANGNCVSRTYTTSCN